MYHEGSTLLNRSHQSSGMVQGHFPWIHCPKTTDEAGLEQHMYPLVAGKGTISKRVGRKSTPRFNQD
jgi:hypothetical protein